MVCERSSVRRLDSGRLGAFVIRGGMKASKEPIVSVIMPVYNAEKYLEQALTSIMGQSFREFEYIVINDGSSDESAAILEAYARRYKAIKLFYQENRGIIRSLNRGLEMAAGRYVARMDADDVSLPQRLERQVAFLERHPNCVLLGTWADIQIEDGLPDRIHSHPAHDPALRWNLLFDTPFVHSSVMIRRDAVRTVGGYAENLPPRSPEDFELWSRLAKDHEVANLPEVLHIYRETTGSYSRIERTEIQTQIIAVSARNLAWTSERDMADAACYDLAALHHGAYERVSRAFRMAHAKTILRSCAKRLQRQPSNAEMLNERLSLEMERLNGKVKRLQLYRLAGALGFAPFIKKMRYDVQKWQQSRCGRNNATL